MKKILLLLQYSFAFLTLLIINLIFISVRFLKKTLEFFLLLPFLILINLYLFLFLFFLKIVVKFLFKNKKFIKELRVNNQCASIIIVNWNGSKFIKKCLDSVIEAVKYSKKPHEVIVVDNGSTDNSLEIIKNYTSSIKLIKLDKNYYYSGGNNVGIKVAKNDIVVLLNNDMIVDKNFLNPLLKHFDKKNLFSVASQIFFQDPKKRREETGRTKGKFKNGFIEIWHDNLAKYEKKFDTILYGGGGATAFNKKMLLYLGGIDEIWSPFYWEDTDLSFRAWRRGWFSIVEPKSIVYHKHQATSKVAFKKKFIDTIKKRNMYLFHWLHLLDIYFIFQHLFFLPIDLAKKIFFDGFNELIPLLLAISKSPRILRRRVREIREQVYTDKEIFRNSNNLFYFRDIYPDFFPKKGYSKRLSILYVCPYVPSSITHAGAARMYQVIRMMSQLGHKVSVLCFANNEEEANLKKYLAPLCQELKVIVRHPVLNYRNFIKFDFVNNDFYDPDFEKELLNFLNKIDFDIVHYKYYQIAAYIKPSKRIINFFSDYENSLLVLKRSFKKNSIESFFSFVSLLRRTQNILANVDVFINLTDIDANNLKSYFPYAKPIVINTGVDTEYFFRNEKIKENPAYLAFVGYFNHPPNVDGVLFFLKNIFPKVLQKYPYAHFYIIGRDPPFKITQLINRNITLTGFVKDIRPYINRAGIFVVPIRYGAGIRGKILQAWSMKKAVIATSRAVEGLIVKNGKNAIVTDDPEKFASSIIELIEDEKKRKDIALQGYLTAKKYYSWDIKIKELENLYFQNYRQKYDSFFYS